MAKSNIRSIRFSDEIAEIIDSQIGDNFNAKFERLVYNCYMLKEERENEVKRLEDEIAKQKARLIKIREDVEKITCYNEIIWAANNLSNKIYTVADRIEKM